MFVADEAEGKFEPIACTYVLGTKAQRDAMP